MITSPLRPDCPRATLVARAAIGSFGHLKAHNG
jgi:hypothetical protein